MDLSGAGELLQTIGAVAGLLAAGTTTWFTIARYRRETTHATVTFRYFSDRVADEGSDVDGTLRARLSVHARRFYLEHAWIYVGDSGAEARRENNQPKWLEAGESLEITSRLVDVLSFANSVQEHYTGKAMPESDEDKLSVSFDCGEGEHHRARLPRADRAAVRATLVRLREQLARADNQNA